MRQKQICFETIIRNYKELMVKLDVGHSTALASLKETIIRNYKV